MEPRASNKLNQYINEKIRLTLRCNRNFIGILKCFDHHMNVILDDCKEFHIIKLKGKQQREEKRVLGLVMFRGELVISITFEGPRLPPNFNQTRDAWDRRVAAVQKMHLSQQPLAMGLIPPLISNYPLVLPPMFAPEHLQAVRGGRAAVTQALHPRQPTPAIGIFPPMMNVLASMGRGGGGLQQRAPMNYPFLPSTRN